MTHADAPSHTLAMTKVPARWCSARKRAALSDWLAFTEDSSADELMHAQLDFHRVARVGPGWRIDDEHARRVDLPAREDRILDGLGARSPECLEVGVRDLHMVDEQRPEIGDRRIDIGRLLLLARLHGLGRCGERCVLAEIRQELL